MSSHDSEEFGGELVHDIIARLEQGWGHLLDALAAAPDGAGDTVAVMRDTAAGDQDAIEAIRRIIEGGEARTGALDVPGDPRAALSVTHERLLGAVDAASRASDDTLARVREAIAPLTWLPYAERTAALRSGDGPDADPV